MDHHKPASALPLHPPSSPPFKLDEGYSDDTRDQSTAALDPSSEDAMTLPDWLLGHSEVDRAGIPLPLVLPCLLTC